MPRRRFHNHENRGLGKLPLPGRAPALRRRARGGIG